MNRFLHFTLCSLLLLQVASAFTAPSSWHRNPFHRQPRHSTKPLERRRRTTTTTSLSNAFAINFHGIAVVEQSGPPVVGVLIAVVGLLAVAGAAVGANALFQAQVSQQMNNLAWMVKEEKPQLWEKLTAQLQPGERIRDRPDLVAELTQIGVNMMQEEAEVDMKRLIAILKEQKLSNDVDERISRDIVESTLGSSIDEFLQKVDKNQGSEYLSTTRGQLAELLKEEFAL